MKRMIDNKEFNTLKSDVNNAKEDIDDIKEDIEDLEDDVENVIPTITIEQSQFTDETHFTLTESQLAQVKGQAAVKVIMGGSIFTGIQRDAVSAIYYSYILLSVTGGALNQLLGAKRIDMVKETGAAEITNVNVGSSKQSYQHLFYAWGDSDRPMYCYFSITNDNPNQMTLTDIKEYCKSNNIIVISNNWGPGNYSLPGVSGNLYNGAWYKIDGVALYENVNGNLLAFHRQSGVLTTLNISSERISDKVVAI